MHLKLSTCRSYYLVPYFLFISQALYSHLSRHPNQKSQLQLSTPLPPHSQMSGLLTLPKGRLSGLLRLPLWHLSPLSLSLQPFLSSELWLLLFLSSTVSVASQLTSLLRAGVCPLSTLVPNDRSQISVIVLLPSFNKPAIPCLHRPSKPIRRPSGL